MKQLITDYTILQFQQGSSKAFEHIFNKYSTPIFLFAKNLTGEEDTAEEITQDVFLKLYSLRTNFQTYENIKAFLFISARNRCIDYFRYSKRQQTNQKEYNYYMPGEEMPKVIDDNLLDALLLTIESLPNRCKITIKFYLEGYSISEIAAILDVEVVTVRNYKAKAYAFLRDNLRG